MSSENDEQEDDIESTSLYEKRKKEIKEEIEEWFGVMVGSPILFLILFLLSQGPTSDFLPFGVDWWGLLVSFLGLIYFLGIFDNYAVFSGI